MAYSAAWHSGSTIRKWAGLPFSCRFHRTRRPGKRHASRNYVANDRSCESCSHSLLEQQQATLSITVAETAFRSLEHQGKFDCDVRWPVHKYTKKNPAVLKD